MTDMENKGLEGQEEQEDQEKEPAGEVREPVEDGFSQPPEPEPQEESEPILPEPQEPLYPDEAAPEPIPEPEPAEAPPAGPEPAPPAWQDIASHTPEPAPGEGSAPAYGTPPPGYSAQGGAVPPPIWQGQTGYVPMPGQPVQAAPPMWQGQPGAVPAPGQAPAGVPYGQAYYGYPGYYPAYPPQQVQANAAPAQPVPQMPQMPQYPENYPGYPQAYGAYGAGYAQPGAEPGEKSKKKKPLGLKILLWVVSILAAGSLIGFGIYCAVDANVRGSKPSFEESNEPDTPNLPGSKPDEETEAPSLPEEKQPEELPNVDVTPNTDGITITPRPEGEPLESKDVYDQVVKSTVAIDVTLTRDGQTAQSRGSGIIATSDGYIITNAHVVLNSKSALVKVATYDGQEYDAVVVGVDRTTDLAVIKTNDHNFTPAVFGDAGELSMGEWVMALGNPGGAKYANSLTRGIVSGLGREAGKYSANGMTYIQTDAAINPGNSGGPLVNMYGQVVGINSSKIVTENYEGMGFAIPVSEAQPIINELLSGGYIKGRTRLGIMIMELDAATAMMNQVPQGLQITQINEDSAFTGTEAQEGDIITALDGETVTTLRDVSDILLHCAPGDAVTVTLYRPASPGGQARELEVTVILLEDKGETQE